jgi:hypothetical protein
MPKTPRNQNDVQPPKIASRDELNAFLEPLTTLKKGDEAIRSYLQQFSRKELQTLMGRAFADALKSPSQKLGTAKPPSAEQPPAVKKKPATPSPRKKGPNKDRRRAGQRRTARR